MVDRRTQAQNFLALNNRKAAATSVRYYNMLEKEVISLNSRKAYLTSLQNSVRSVTNTANDVDELRRRVESQKVASRKREGGKKMKRSRKQSITKRKTRKGAYIRSLLYTGG